MVDSIFLDFLGIEPSYSTAAYIVIQGFDDELTKKMIADYHGIIVLGAGGGLVVLGITVKEKITSN